MKKRRDKPVPVPVGMLVLVSDRMNGGPEQWETWRVIWSDEHGVLGQSLTYDSVRRYFSNIESIVAVATGGAELTAMKRKAEEIFDSYREKYDEIRGKWLVDNPGRIHGEMRDAIAKEIEVPRGILQALTFRDY